MSHGARYRTCFGDIRRVAAALDVAGRARLVDSLELLAPLVHPERFPEAPPPAAAERA